MDLLSELEKGEHVDLNAQARMREKLFLGPNSNGAPNSRQEKKGTLKVKRPNAFNQPGIGPPGQISANSSDILKLNSDLQPIDCLLPPSINARMRKQGQSSFYGQHITLDQTDIKPMDCLEFIFSDPE